MNTYGVFTSFDAELVERDGIFSLHDFMRELEKLYNAVRFYIALNTVAVGDDDAAFEMRHEGRHFEMLPFLERYKHPEPVTPDIDVSSADGDLLREMQLYSKYFEGHPEEHLSGPYREPYEDFNELCKRLIECIPDFRLRLKLDPKSEIIVFAADAHFLPPNLGLTEQLHYSIYSARKSVFLKPLNSFSQSVL